MRHNILSILFIMCFFLTSCSPKVMKAIATGMAVASNNRVQNSNKLMIFGGSNHNVYLGCLSCSKYATDSVFNTYGSYGNSFNSQSIYNSYGSYGSKFSSSSPCNSLATDPPIVVDQDGNFYGYLTVNIYNSKKISDPNIKLWLNNVCND